MSDHVILVDENDNEIGTMPKIEAHEKGKLHRAFSVFVFNSKGELLLQQRAFSKYHSGGLWTNTCCSHPQQKGTILDAAKRRLMEEMGMQCKLEKKFDFIYKAPMTNGLTEYEYDHVLFGESNTTPNINKNEVHSWNYFSVQEIEQQIKFQPQAFTEWFKICFKRVKQLINERNDKHILA